MHPASITAPRVQAKAFILAILSLLIAISARPSPTVQSPQASYIIQGRSLEEAVSLVEKYGGTITSRLEIINGVGALLPQQAVSLLEGETGISQVSPNHRFRIAGSDSGSWAGNPPTDYPDVVGADQVWSQGVTGMGVGVAVLDTGLSLQAGVRDRVAGWVDLVETRNLPYDPNGHGTHVGSIIANNQIGKDGEWNGVAPGAHLVIVRVLDEDGGGTYERVIQGIQWVLENQTYYQIRVMNMSLVTPAWTPYWADPINKAVMKAWAAGIVVVTAAGNDGPAPVTIGVPGNNPYVITVGAFTDHFTPSDWQDDYIPSFSAAGPTLDAFVKPDVMAPGAHMVSAMMPSSQFSRQHPENRVDSQYFSMSGTSQSTAVVSGLVALILSAQPDLSPDQVKYRLMVTALPWLDLAKGVAPYSLWQQGAGRVDAPSAVFARVSGKANQGLDIQADLDGIRHFQGYSYYDPASGKFLLHGDDGSLANGLGNWSGGLGNWSGGLGNWSGGLGNWSGGLGNWSGGLGNWSGGTDIQWWIGMEQDQIISSVSAKERWYVAQALLFIGDWVGDQP